MNLVHRQLGSRYSDDDPLMGLDPPQYRDKQYVHCCHGWNRDEPGASCTNWIWRGWASLSGVGGESVAGRVALTGENPISSGWIGMVGSGIGLSTKALNKALQEGKALHKGIKALHKGIKALHKGKGKEANRICSGKR